MIYKFDVHLKDVLAVEEAGELLAGVAEKLKRLACNSWHLYNRAFCTVDLRPIDTTSLLL